MKTIVLLALAAWPWASAWSLQPDQGIAQMSHQGWTQQNYAPSTVNAFAQTPDGRFWLCATSGLSFFDGTSFRQSPTGLPASDILTSLVATDGALWLGFRHGGVSVRRGRTQTDYDQTDGLPPGKVHAIAQDGAGTIWAATDSGLAFLAGTRWVQGTAEPGLVGASALAAHVDRSGSLWVATAAAVFVRARATTAFIRVGNVSNAVDSRAQFAEDAEGGIWLSTDAYGLLHFAPTKDANMHGFVMDRERWLAQRRIGAIAFDSRGNLWMASHGLLRLPADALANGASERQAESRIERFSRRDGLTSDTVRTLFEDREGTVWVATGAGVDKFRRSDVFRVGLPADSGAGKAMAADAAGSVWIADSNGRTISRFDAGKLTQQWPSPRFTAAMRDREGKVWFGGPEGIATLEHGRFDLLPLSESARGNDVQTMVQDAAGAIWISVDRSGLFRRDGKSWTPYGNLSDLPQLPPLVAAADSAGNIWFGYTRSRLARVTGTTVRLFTPADGLNIGSITALFATQSQLFVGGEIGLTTFDGTRFQRLTALGCPDFQAVSGLVMTSGGALWVARGIGLSHFLNAGSEMAASDFSGRIDCDMIGRRDGSLPGTPQLGRTPSLIPAADGRLWIAATDGLAWIDGAYTRPKSLAPAVSIFMTFANDQSYAANQTNEPLPLPMKTESVKIDYNSWTSSTERVLFDLQLEHDDKTVQTSSYDSSATYVTMSPGAYRFQVKATNDYQTWSAPATLEFVILPAFYQTTWFRLVLIALAAALVALLYRLQLARAHQRFRERLEERLIERERIARELHDTLLQGTQGLIYRIQAALEGLPGRDSTRIAMEEALDVADDVLADGRDRVTGLRDKHGASVDLGDALSAIGQRLNLSGSHVFEVVTLGKPSPLHPVVREELQSIAAEALANAFRHSHAAHIGVQLHYSQPQMIVRITDDGCGMEAELIANGLPGHWGLQGMRERADRIHGTLQISSSPTLGTTVELRVPASLAYGGGRQWPGWLSFWKRTL